LSAPPRHAAPKRYTMPAATTRPRCVLRACAAPGSISLSERRAERQKRRGR
jgi:hypothetical protein